MKLLTKTKYIQALVLSVLLFGVVAVVRAPHAFAASKTWTGGGSDRKWSTAGNWSPSGAPANGDDIIIGNDSNPADIEIDSSGVSVSSVTWTGGSDKLDATAHGITVTDAVNGTGASGVTYIFGNITLGGDVTWNNTSIGTSSPSSTYSLTLNSHTLTVQNTGSYIMSFDQPIAGSGTVVYDTSQGQGVQLYSPNTYSGQTVINGNDGILTVDLTPSQAFGSSSVTVKSGASLSISLPNGATTFNNAITLEASTNATDSSTWSYISVSCSGDCTSAQLALPNVTLQGNVRMLATGNVVINLAGIQANGYCVEYNDTLGASFQNGPAACDLGDGGATNVPGVPNTGAQPKDIVVLAVVTSILALVVAGYFANRKWHFLSK